MKRLVSVVIVCAGCIRAPTIVMVDRSTALEQQAAGSFDELERKLTRSAIAARPVPLTPDQLEALGIRPPPLVDSTDMTDADRVDALLKQHCIGEGRDGTLVDTHAACVGAADRAAAAALIDRANRARNQLWRWMHDQRSDTTLDELRRAWRKAHTHGVVCGGWLERDKGGWEAKKC